MYGSRQRLADASEGPGDYQVHAAAHRRPSMADQPSMLRRPSGYSGPAASSRRYRSTGNLSGERPHRRLFVTAAVLVFTGDAIFGAIAGVITFVW